MQWHNESAEQVLSTLRTTPEGLTPDDAARRLAETGPNKLTQAKGLGLVQRFLKQLADPMVIILIVAAAISAVTALLEGESLADVFIILAVVLINAVLGVYQENKAEKAIEALQNMMSPTSKVIRAGELKHLPSEELVPGDVLALEAGDAVPADARILESASLQVEEAALTGESVPVYKQEAALPTGAEPPLGDRKNMLYMGGTVVYGRGRAVVTATGMQTEMGKIAGALALAEDQQTPLQKRLHQLSRVLTFVVIGICAFIFAFSLLRSGDFSGEMLMDTFLIAVSLAVAAIPEGLAAVVTVVLSIGVTRMSKRSAVIRRLTAVETLGCAQIICSDKTGTLTQNRMTVVEHFGDNEPLLARAMALCTDAEWNGEAAVGEPTEAALVTWAAKLGMPKGDLSKEMPRAGEAPFDSMRKMMTTLHSANGRVVQYTKGAPDEIIARCTHVLRDGKPIPMTDALRAELLGANKNMADRALRVLAAATRDHDALPGDMTPAALEQDMTFIGLTGMIDPVRPEVKPAIDECYAAGIRPIMITGDHRDTAVAIAGQLGILREGQRAITGAELSAIDEATLSRDIENYSVYARVQPEHKVRIVQAWQQRGKVAAMTGDGVNDAPSIKRADIGVGMGITGTDVTKNVADMVLADDNFATIVKAVDEGRRIYDNIRKAIQFLLASNLSEVLSIFIATLLGFTILKPVHILWINLITDTFPALALGMEPAEADLMRRPPRGAQEGIFSGGVGAGVVYQGALVTLLTLAAYFIGARQSANDGMTMAFLTMSMAEIFHAYNMRSQIASIFSLKKQNWFLVGAMVVSFLLTTGVLYIPFMAALFGFAPIVLSEYAAAMGLALAVVPLVEAVKWVQRRRRK
ncbi:MAG: cation-translocating P-type ATPase [Oscillospiraceae bacterium]|jgi:Ca2+-transporting ATPase|nr:cation-translocating P-type ATPase [Oscillospiraceae bacterium]